VAGIFFVVELFGAANRATRDHSDAVIPVLLYAALLYLVITIPLGQIAGRIEKKVAVLR
jgi:glutamate transport system permease protein